MKKKIDDLESGFEESVMAEESLNKIKELERIVASLYKTLEEYGIDTISPLTDVEYICTKGLQNLKLIAESGMLNKDDANVMDLLHKNLRIARGNFEKKEPKGKASSIEELLRIVDGGKK